MFNSSIKFQNNAKPFFDALSKKLVNPEWELDQASKRVMTDIQQHFNKTMNPVGGRWKPSQRVLKHGGKTLTKSSALRRGLRSRIKPSKKLQFDIQIYPTGKSITYASVHNNGGKMRSRSGSIWYMPRRRFAWVSTAAKKEIENLFLFGI